jgi:glycosyltransferase involved in cell wall biosynthesis
MKNLALLTPWPPQHSGIADYAYDLATILAEHDLRIVVYTTEESPLPLNGITIHTVDAQDGALALDGFDCIVYQLGNNTDFHLWMIPLLKKHPGVIHLHDLVMHHMAAWLTWLQGETDAYLQLLEKWHGPQGLLEGQRSIEQEDYLWNSDRVAEFPLCEEYLQDAHAIIVHSTYALRHVRKTCGHVPSFQLPQLYKMGPKASAPGAVRRISVLGGVDPQKRLDWVIGALAALSSGPARSIPLELHIAGGIDPRCEYLLERAQKLDAPNLKVEFHGRVNEDHFMDIFTSTDLCIALRYPTMGETSAIVMKALQLGIPTIVNDIGWYAELPAAIVKQLPVENCQQKLTQLVEYLLLEPDAFKDWSRRCLDYAQTEFSLDIYGERYIELCDNPEGVELITDIMAQVLADCDLKGSDDEDDLLQNILSESYF